MCSSTIQLYKTLVNNYVFLYYPVYKTLVNNYVFLY